MNLNKLIITVIVFSSVTACTTLKKTFVHPKIFYYQDGATKEQLELDQYNCAIETNYSGGDKNKKLWYACMKVRGWELKSCPYDATSANDPGCTWIR